MCVRRQIQVLVFLAILFLGFNLLVFAKVVQAEETPSTGVNLSANVLPQITIFVDANLAIEKIVSNSTSPNAKVIVVGKNIKQLPYGKYVRQLYSTLEPSLDFSRPGIIYQRSANNTPFSERVMNIIESVYNRINALFV